MSPQRAETLIYWRGAMWAGQVPGFAPAAANPMMAANWAAVPPGMMPGQMPAGPATNGVHRSMHDLHRGYRPSSPSGSQKSTRSKKSNRYCILIYCIVLYYILLYCIVL